MIKEIKKFLKCSVSNPNLFPVEFLELVSLKDTTVQVRHFSEQPLSFSVPFRVRFRKPLKEEGAEKIGIVSIITVDLALPQFGLQVVCVVVQKAFLLNKVDKHQAIQHHRSVPAFHLLVRNPFEKFEKPGVFRCKTLIKSLGHAFHVEGRPYTPPHVYQCEIFFFVEANSNRFQF